MKLLLVRHGDPDYTIDSLTEKGLVEADLLATRLSKLDVKEFYVSPLGRAKKTAEPTLQAIGRTAIEKPWLREFEAPIKKPYMETTGITWDWLPGVWTEREGFYDKDEWMNEPELKEAEVIKQYEWVTSQFDELLAEHGYKRENHIYRAVCPNNDTLVFFCHFGLECVLLGHLLGVSPMIMWHGFCAAPTSVTTVITEERRPGIATFRVNGFGDISHLYANQEPPAFAARFSECYTNEGERLD